MNCPNCRLEVDAPHGDLGACILALDAARARVEQALDRFRRQPTGAREQRDRLGDDEKTPPTDRES